MRIICITVGIFLAGCSTVNPIEVPVPVPCKIPAVEIPALPVDALQGNENIFDKTKALWSSIETQEAVIKEMQSAMKACQ